MESLLNQSDGPVVDVKRRLSKARSVTVLTGAGISADSGVPTFRGKDGLWRNFKAEELATPEAFRKNPRLVWEWYGWRRDLIASKSPNAAHHALVALEERIPGFTLITQNVDGLHSRAGSKNIIELHGNIWKTRCTACREVTPNTDIPLQLLPQCQSCRSLLRPHIVWFGEELDPANIQSSIEALQSSEVVLVIGTSGVVQPAASFAAVAKSSGAFIVEVNLDSSGITGDMDVTLRGNASRLVPKLL